MHSKQELIEMLAITHNRTVDFMEEVINNKTNSAEYNLEIGKTNPLLWQFGHILFFWEHKTLRLLDIEEKIVNKLSLKNSSDIYDSFIVNLEDRYTIEQYDIETILKCYNSLFQYLRVLLNSDDLKFNSTTFYLIFLSLLHNEMHNESILYTLKLLNKQKPSILGKIRLPYTNTNSVKHKMILVEGNVFIQGIASDRYNFTFDNEQPGFKVTINDFNISKYPVTELQYLQFILDGGYRDEKYWCKPGWRWLTKKSFDKPMYWKSNGGSYIVMEWSTTGSYERSIGEYPVCHISWYEACAYCRYVGGRLPTESEWEYLATEGGSNLNPPIDGNLDYKYGSIVPVNFDPDSCSDKGRTNRWSNSLGVHQLFGNCWEWCQEPIYPYDGFTIDPVYREMSYPFFGYKKICRGGCWAVPKYLINCRYRNAQMPDNRTQFIGFRVVKNDSKKTILNKN
jgi:iron(II)-dependent oxidoreductase